MTAQPSMFSVYDGQRCLGFLLQRGKSGVEAFDAQERSLGLFPTLKEAAAAITSEIEQLDDEDTVLMKSNPIKRKTGVELGGLGRRSKESSCDRQRSRSPENSQV